jgi:hypothetical protein
MTAPPQPPWLRAHLAHTGDDPTLTGTHAHPRHCKTCGHLTLTGYDAPLIAGLAITNPNPLTPQLETAAVILAIPTWRLWGTPGHYELTPRHIPGLHTIGRHPPASDVTVLAAHQCGTPPLSHAPLPTRTHTPEHDTERIPY